MILYLTKETFERYNLKMPEQMQNEIPKNIAQRVLAEESGDRLLEWGCKLFYFDRRKCLQVVNFASQLMIVLVDFRVPDLPNLGDAIAHYLFKLYKDDKKMTRALENYFAAHPAVALSRLKDRKTMSRLNYNQRTILEDGYLLQDYIWDGILHTVELNQWLCKNEVVCVKCDGKKDYFDSMEYFKKQVTEQYL